MSNKNDAVQGTIVQAIIDAYEAGREAYGNAPAGTRAPHTPGSDLSQAWYIGWSVGKREEDETVAELSAAMDVDDPDDD